MQGQLGSECGWLTHSISALQVCWERVVSGPFQPWGDNPGVGFQHLKLEPRQRLLGAGVLLSQGEGGHSVSSSTPRLWAPCPGSAAYWLPTQPVGLARLGHPGGMQLASLIPSVA